MTLISSARQIGSTELALRSSEQLYEQLQERFKLNMISAKDLLDAELMLSAARLSQNGAYYSYLKARAALLQLLALDNAAELDKLIEN